MSRSLAVLVTLGLLVGAPLRAARAQDGPRSAPQVAPSLDDTELGQAIDPGLTIDAEELLKAWSLRLNQQITTDPQMKGTVLRFSEQTEHLTWGLFKKVLDFHDIVLEEKQVDGRWITFAHLRRNLASKVAPPFRVIKEGEPLPDREEVVTAILRIEHGAGNDIFATVRGLLVRDVNRIGNILYIRGPETILIVDVASNVAYYSKIIRALDVAAPGSVTRVLSVENVSAEDAAQALEALYHGSLAPPRVVACGEANKIVVTSSVEQGEEIRRILSEIDVTSKVAHPRFHPAGEGLTPVKPNVGWQIAAGFATLAFLGQTIILRRIQRRLTLGRL